MVKLPPDSLSTYLASVSIPAVNAREGPQTERFHATLGLFWALAGSTAAMPSITPSASLPDCVIVDPPRNWSFFGIKTAPSRASSQPHHPRHPMLAFAEERREICQRTLRVCRHRSVLAACGRLVDADRHDGSQYTTEQFQRLRIRSRRRLLDEPLRQRLGQCGDGELLLGQERANSA